MGGATLTSDDAVATDGLFAALPILLNGQATGADDLFGALSDFNPSPAYGVSWRESGNLRGNVPVKYEDGPPDIRVVEDQALFDLLRSAVMAAARDQLAIASSFMSGGTVVDQRYWFAKSYYRVTAKLLEYVDDASFYYPTYVLFCMLYFKKVYVDNLNRYNVDKGCEPQWREAFSYSTPEIGQIVNSFVPFTPPPDKSLGGMASALVNVMRSAEAHIRYDLSRCAAWIFLYHYPWEVIDIAVFEEDFFAMAELFEETSAEMQAEIYEYTGALLASVPLDVGPFKLLDLVTELANGATLAQERVETWQRAEDLVDVLGRGLRCPYILVQPQGGLPSLEGDVTMTDYLVGFEDIPNAPTMEGSMNFELFMSIIHTPAESE